MFKVFLNRLKQATVISAGTVGIVLLSTGASFASSEPVYYAGQTVDVFTLPGNGHNGFTISLFSNSNGYSDTVPLTYVGKIQGDFTPNFAKQDGISWGTTWDEFSFQMPKNPTAGGTYGALINTKEGGAVFTRFAGYPDPNFPYGTQFTYAAAATLPTGQLPEVPWAAALPLVTVGAVGLVLFRRALKNLVSIANSRQ